jgi:glucose-1-phosphate cytidylyltransferase
MKVVILAGGLGTRISEETQVRPKPMVEIGGKPILWHLMKIYSHHGFNDFIVCLGHKGYVIKEYFANYFLHSSDVTFHVAENRVDVHERHAEPWHVTLVDTGDGTQTGGRLKRVARYLDGETDFCFTYGDGLCDVNVRELVGFHRAQNTIATITTVQPPFRFGMVTMENRKITEFREKPQTEGSWINGGFFVVKRAALDYVDGDATIWERAPLERLAHEGELSAFVHKGFWHPMDHVRDKALLEELWASGKAPWKVWSDR